MRERDGPRRVGVRRDRREDQGVRLVPDDRRRRGVAQRGIDERLDARRVDLDAIACGCRREHAATRLDGRVDGGPMPEHLERCELRGKRRLVIVDPDRVGHRPQRALDPGDRLLEPSTATAIAERVGEHPLHVERPGDLCVPDDAGRPLGDELDLTVLERTEGVHDRVACRGLRQPADRDTADHDAGQDLAAVVLGDGRETAHDEQNAEQRGDDDAAKDLPEISPDDVRCRRDGLCGGHPCSPRADVGADPASEQGDYDSGVAVGRGSSGLVDSYCANVSQSSGLPLR